ncbi:MAG: cation:proton antiporter, partial [Fastidiosipila sp.]|nr:cation:proton antiporter [Fastidiosipila sp.]
TPVVIATLNAFVAMVFVVLALAIFGFPFPLALVLGAIAAATAPAATVMVIKQYQARGPFTETLLSVVAIDDAVTLIIFGFNAAIARTLIAGEFSFLSILRPFAEVLGSMLAGAALGLILTFAFRFFSSRSNRLILLLSFITLGIFVSQLLGISSLLLIMTMSAMVANLYHDHVAMDEELDHFTPPIFMLFFVLSGARLDPRVLPTIGLLGVVYLVVRVIGKLTGAYLGAVIMKAPDNVRKYLGPALIPQAGVAISLSYAAQSMVPMYATQIQSVILTATLVYELVGPVATKWSLGKANEIKR